MGKSAYFVRLYGCPLKCKWCDSAGTWHKNWTPPSIEKESAENLLKNKRDGDFVVLTGGEPAIFDLNEIVDCCHEDFNSKIHLETSGAFEVKGEFDWITVSPKWSKLPLKENIDRAHEIKIIVEDENSIKKWLDVLKLDNKAIIWLHPEWSQRSNKKVLNSISNSVKTIDMDLRAGYQLHKLYSVDQLDFNSKKNVPLGGETKNEY